MNLKVAPAKDNWGADSILCIEKDVDVAGMNMDEIYWIFQEVK